jgi:hypothetical protein
MLKHIEGRSGGDEGNTPVEDKDDLLSLALARIIDVLGEGEIGGLEDGAKSVFLDDTALMAPDGKYNFKGVKFHARNGTPNQSPIPGIVAIESEQGVGAEIVKNTPIIRTINEPDIDDLRIKIMTPSLYQVDKNDGDMHGSEIEFRIEIRTVGGVWQNPFGKDLKIRGKCTSSYERRYIITDVLQYGPAPWEIRITRITADSSTQRRQNKLYWASSTGLINETFYWPHVASVGLEINAKQFGTHVPTRSYNVFGRNTLKIPTNYDPLTREYSGVWDGTFKNGWTNNPAWIFHDLVSDKRYGLGAPAAYIDKWTLYEIAQYCDGMVKTGYKNAQGNAIMEPRYTCNVVFQTQEEAYHLLNALASSFLAMPFWASGMVTMAQDSPKAPTHLANQTNVIEGEFTYSGTGLDARHSVALVTWNDPIDSCRPAIEAYYDPELVRKVGWNPTDVIALGCTSRSQALRVGRWIIDTEKHQPETVTFVGGWDFADAVPGAIIKVMDPSYSGVRFGGRVKAGSTLEDIQLDGEVLLIEGQTYTLTCVLPNKTIQEKAVLNGPGTYTELHTLQFSDQPEANALWVLTGSSLAPRHFRVITNKEIEPHRYEIFALYHDPDKFARVERDIIHEAPPETIGPKGALEPPAEFNITVFTNDNGKNHRLGVLCSWEAVQDARVLWYEVDFREAEGNWRRFAESSVNSAERFDVRLGTYSFRIRSRGIAKTSEWLEVTDVIIDLPDKIPPDVAGLQLKGGGTAFTGKQCVIKWSDLRDSEYFSENRFRNYVLNICDIDDVVMRRVRLTSTTYRYTLHDMKTDFGTVPRSFKARVKVRDAHKFDSNNWTEITITKTAPSLLAFNPTCVGAHNGIVVRLDNLPIDDQDCDGYKVLCDTSNPPTTLVANVAAQARDTFIRLLPADPTTYRVRIVPYDRIGDGVASDVKAVLCDPDTIRPILRGRVGYEELIQDIQDDLDRVEDMGIDSKVSRAEKLPLKREWNQIVREGTPTTGTLPLMALSVGVSKTAFEAVFTTLNAYLNTTLQVFASMSTSTTIVRATWDDKWEDYYDEKAKLLKAVTDKVKDNAAAAQAKADNADTVAANSMALIDDMATDAKISKVEKHRLKQKWNVILKEGNPTDGKIIVQAQNFAVAHDVFDSMYSALNTYLNTTLSLFSPMTVSTTITRTTWDARWENYYEERTKLLNAIAQKAKLVGDTAQTAANTADAKAVTADGKAVTAQTAAATADAKAVTADAKAVTADGKAVTADGKAVTAQTAANTAQSTANTAVTNAAAAQATANTAKAYTDDLAADTKITSSEKPGLQQAWEIVVEEGTATTGTIPAQAIVFGVSHATFDTAFSALDTYLNTTVNVFGNMATSSTIVRATWKTTWKTYYSERTKLLKAIADKARTLANTAQTAANTADGKAVTADGKAVTAQTAAATADAKAVTADGKAVTADGKAVTAQTAANTADGKAVTAQSRADLAHANAATAQAKADDAFADAAAAQADASSAKTYTDDLAADTKITRSEKRGLKQAWDLIVIEGTATTGTIPAQAIVFGVAHATFDTDYADLNTYLNTTVNVFGNMTTSSTIVRATWDAKWKDYYNERTALLNAIAAKARTLANTADAKAVTADAKAVTADGKAVTADAKAVTADAKAVTADGKAVTAQTAANTAQSTANTAVTNAAAAQADASSAKAYTDDLAADTKITRSEKRGLKQAWDLIVIEGTPTTGKIPAQAIALGVSHSVFDTEYADLNTYLNTTVNVFGNMTTSSTIVRATWDLTWKNYYNERTKLLNAIAAMASTLASWSGVSGSGRPEDSATLGAKLGTNLKKSDGITIVTDDDLFLNGLWARTITLSGSSGSFRSSSTYPRIEIDKDFIAGKTSSTVKEFYIQASTGKAYAGGGAVVLDSNGLTIAVPPLYTLQNSISFMSGTTLVGDMYVSREIDCTLYLRCHGYETESAANVYISANPYLGSLSSVNLISSGDAGAESAIRLRANVFPGITHDTEGSHSFYVSHSERFSITDSTVTIDGNTAWHAGNDGSGSTLDADLLDGYHAADLATRVTRTTTVDAIGWYRIAYNGPVAAGQTGGTRASAIFTIRDTMSGRHSMTVIRASCHYGGEPTITLLSRSAYGNDGAIKKIRIVYGGTYEGFALEVYSAAVGSVGFNMYQNDQSSGWSVADWAAGSVPVGLSSFEFDLTGKPMMGCMGGGMTKPFELRRDGSLQVPETLIIAPTVGPAMTLDKIGGFATIKAAVDKHMIIDSSGQYVSLNHFVSDNVVLCYGGGKVGVGLVAPQGHLHVYSASEGVPAEILMTNVLTPSGVSEVGVLWFGSAEGLGYRAAGIKGIAEGDFNPGDWPCALSFLTTADATATPVERMRITASGSVNVGTIAISGSTIGSTVSDSNIIYCGGVDVDHGGNLNLYGRDHATRPGWTVLRFGGYDATGLFRFEHGNTDGTNTLLAAMDYRGNFSLGNGAMPTSGYNTLNLTNGTPPGASLTDSFLMYSADIIAGNAAAHFRSEAGNIVKLYTQAFIAAPATTTTSLKTAVDGLRTILINAGLMAAS